MSQPIDLEDSHQLVDPWDRQIQQRVDILSVEPRAVFEDLAERAPMLAEPPREGARRIELHGVERGAQACGHGGEGDAERVAEGMRRIGRDDQDAKAGGGLRHGMHGGTGGLADAALTAVEDEPGRVRSQSLTSHFSLSS